MPDGSHLKRAELGGFSELINLSAGFLKEYLLFWGKDGIAFAVIGAAHIELLLQTGP